MSEDNQIPIYTDLYGPTGSKGSTKRQVFVSTDFEIIYLIIHVFKVIRTLKRYNNS